jgi:hypothetical protein
MTAVRDGSAERKSRRARDSRPAGGAPREREISISAALEQGTAPHSAPAAWANADEMCSTGRDPQTQWVENEITHMRLKSVIARVRKNGGGHQILGFVLNHGMFRLRRVRIQ